MQGTTDWRRVPTPRFIALQGDAPYGADSCVLSKQIQALQRVRARAKLYTRCVGRRRVLGGPPRRRCRLGGEPSRRRCRLATTLGGSGGERPATQHGEVHVGRLGRRRRTAGPLLQFSLQTCHAREPTSGDSRAATGGNFDILRVLIGDRAHCEAFPEDSVIAAGDPRHLLPAIGNPQVVLRLLRHCGCYRIVVHSTCSTPPPRAVRPMRAWPCGRRCCTPRRPTWHLWGSHRTSRELSKPTSPPTRRGAARPVRKLMKSRKVAALQHAARKRTRCALANTFSTSQELPGLGPLRHRHGPVCDHPWSGVTGRLVSGKSLQPRNALYTLPSEPKWPGGNLNGNAPATWCRGSSQCPPKLP